MPLPTAQYSGKDLVTNWRNSRQLRTKLLARWELAKRNPHLFFRWFVYTNKVVPGQDGQSGENVVSKFPWERPHTGMLTDLWLWNQVLAFIKARQLLLTWWASGITLWDGIAHMNRLLLFQGKRLDDVVGSRETGDGLLGRAKFILDHIPARELLLPALNERNILLDRLVLPDSNSLILGIPQGADVIRQRTPSGVVIDEATMQDKFAEALTATIPCIRSGGWLVMIATAGMKDGGQFKRIVHDLPDED